MKTAFLLLLICAACSKGALGLMTVGADASADVPGFATPKDANLGVVEPDAKDANLGVAQPDASVEGGVPPPVLFDARPPTIPDGAVSVTRPDAGPLDSVPGQDVSREDRPRPILPMACAALATCCNLHAIHELSATCDFVAAAGDERNCSGMFTEADEVWRDCYNAFISGKRDR